MQNRIEFSTEIHLTVELESQVACCLPKHSLSWRLAKLIMFLHENYEGKLVNLTVKEANRTDMKVPSSDKVEKYVFTNHEYNARINDWYKSIMVAKEEVNIDYMQFYRELDNQANERKLKQFMFHRFELIQGNVNAKSTFNLEAFD